MNRTYECRVPKDLYEGHYKEAELLEWRNDFSMALCWLFAKEICKRMSLEMGDLRLDRDDFAYTIQFKRDETAFAITFDWLIEDDDFVKFEVTVDVYNFKRLLVFRLRRQPTLETFNKFTNLFLEIAELNALRVQS